MPASFFNKTSVLFLLILAFFFSCSFAEEAFPFKGEVNSDGINIRSDATVGSKAICTVGKGQIVEVVKELYGWYKIRLPARAPVYIKKGLAECVKYEPNATSRKACLGAIASGNNINVRLLPNESSAILGTINKGEPVTVTEETAGWYKIQPTTNTFGWIYKKFVNKKEE